LRVLLERFDGGSFVVFHVENGVELGDLEQIVDLFGEVEEFQLAALVLGRGESTDELADAGAIDVVHFGQVENDLLVTFREQVTDGITKNDAAFAERDAAARVNNGDAIHLPSTNLHCHWEASLPPAVGPWTCLISLSSVPVED